MRSNLLNSKKINYKHFKKYLLRDFELIKYLYKKLVYKRNFFKRLYRD